MSREEEVRSLVSRRRNILYLIAKYLSDSCLPSSAACLQSEAKLLPEYEICDNIDLDTIYLEYSSYCHLKFGKYPKVLKKTTVEQKQQIPRVLNQKKTSREKRSESIVSSSGDGSQQLPNTLKITQLQKPNEEPINTVDPETPVESGEVNPLPGWKGLSEIVQGTIINKKYPINWEDICGNINAVKILKEAVIFPLKFPKLFTGNIKPWKSVLLFGPPGSGKTTLAKILASEVYGSFTFFNVTSSTVTSKWRGESEKIIKTLFDFARVHAPSIIFIDEIEGLTSKRNQEYEGSRRAKNELLQQMDGMDNDNQTIFILASTNLPWDIDSAFLRRFEKKILMELPNFTERKSLIERFLKDIKLENEQLEQLSKNSEGFTGDEIRIACKDIKMKQIRQFYDVMNTQNSELEIDAKLCKKKYTQEELEESFLRTHPISKSLMPKFIEWEKIYKN